MTPKEFAEMWVNREFTSEDADINTEVLANLIDQHFVSRSKPLLVAPHEKSTRPAWYIEDEEWPANDTQ